MNNEWHTDRISELVIGKAIEVHRHLGPGLLETIYTECLSHELATSGIAFNKEYAVPIEYKGIKLSLGYRLDLYVESQLVVEIKTVELLLPVHKAQLLTYMKLCKATRGLLLNFNVVVMKDGIRRVEL